MSPIRLLARPLLSSIFISTGVNTLRDPSYATFVAREAGLSQPEQLAKVHGATNLLGGLALATNRFPRLAALGLAAGLVPPTLMGHAFWSAPEDQKAMQQINFIKNVSLIGGLLIAFADTGGRESIPHRVGRVTGRAARKAEKKAVKAQKRAAKGVQSVASAAHLS